MSIGAQPQVNTQHGMPPHMAAKSPSLAAQSDGLGKVSTPQGKWLPVKGSMPPPTQQKYIPLKQNSGKGN